MSDLDSIRAARRRVWDRIWSRGEFETGNPEAVLEAGREGGLPWAGDFHKLGEAIQGLRLDQGVFRDAADEVIAGWARLRALPPDWGEGPRTGRIVLAVRREWAMRCLGLFRRIEIEIRLDAWIRRRMLVPRQEPTGRVVQRQRILRIPDAAGRVVARGWFLALVPVLPHGECWGPAPPDWLLQSYGLAGEVE